MKELKPLVKRMGDLGRCLQCGRQRPRAADHCRSATFSLWVAWFCLACPLYIQAADNIATAGDILQILLPVTAGGFTLGYPRSEETGKVADFLGHGEEKLGIGYRDTQGTIQFAESVGLTLGATYILKYAVSERRPNGGSQSFPSGHSSISFSSAEFLRKRYGWEYGIPAYALASFVAYSRVEANQHHPHDVIAGAAIGIGSSYLFARPYKKWTIEADVAPRYYGLRLSRSW
ncbi:MAG TPA: phosphatase PAP2 family protein [Patescibacteria group bacterium]|nr:phosphatase PAP2 family protein [Patescibacteria group bacterium]